MAAGNATRGPHGACLRLTGQRPPYVTRNRASRILSAIGERAGIVVDRRKKRVKGQAVEVVKYASAHDLRRAFGERWASRIMPKNLQELMRHESIETTMKYYVGRNAEATADLLWEAHKNATSNKTGNTTQNRDGSGGSKNALSGAAKGVTKVETKGLEPSTPALQTRCSPN